MTTKAEVIAAIDAALTVANALDDQTAQIAQLTQQRDNAIAARDNAVADALAKQAKIDAARVAAQGEKDADAATVAGQRVLDALA